MRIFYEIKKMNREKIAHGVFAVCALACVVAVGMICVFLFAKAIPTIFEIGFVEFILGDTWLPSAEIFGIAPMIVGSFLVTFLSLFLGVPLGILSALYLAFFAPLKIKKILVLTVELLAAVPSIVYGFFGLVVIVPFLSPILGTSGKGLLAASILLSIMVLPTLILMSQTALEAVNQSFLEGGLALGATRERVVFLIMLKAAKSGVWASVILGLGRVMGEAMAVIVVAGNQALFPESIADGIRTLTTNLVLELGYATDLHKDALIASVVVLFAFILLLNLLFSLLKGRTR